MKIILKDNTELEAIKVDGTNVYTQGQSRDSLQIHFEKGKYSFDELDKLFSDEGKTETLVIENGEEKYLHSDYILKTSIELKPVVVESATTESEEVTEERVVVTMAQISYAEKTIKKLQKEDTELENCIMELAEMLGGAE